jgi:hypothetical protein
MTIGYEIPKAQSARPVSHRSRAAGNVRTARRIVGSLTDRLTKLQQLVESVEGQKKHHQQTARCELDASAQQALTPSRHSAPVRARLDCARTT